MSTLTRSIAIASVVLFAGISSSSAEETSVPASMSMKVFRFGLSTSPTCENMAIYTIDEPTFVDFTANPTLGSAEVPPGTYHCVALEVDTTMSSTPTRAAGNCKPVTETFDYCPALAVIASRNLPPPPPGSKHGPLPGSSGASGGAGGPGGPGGPGGGPSSADGGVPEPVDYEAVDGVQPLGGDVSQVWRTCKPEGDRLVIYLSTQVPIDAWTNAFRPPTSPTDINHGHALATPLVVGERTTGTFIVSVPAESQEDGTCNFGSPTFAFETVSE